MRKFFLIFLGVVSIGLVTFFIVLKFLPFTEVAVAAVSCTDYETGRNYYNKGSVVTCNDQGECTEFIVDECSDNTLTEKYCESSQLKSETYSCPNGCADGRCLRGGSCYSNTDCTSSQFCEFTGCGESLGTCAVVSSECSTVYDPSCGCNGLTYNNSCLRRKAKISLDHNGRCGVACEESDAKKDYHTKGTIDGYDYKGTHIKTTDACTGSTLKEYYCGTNDLVVSVDYQCPQGCSAGACIVVQVAPEVTPQPTPSPTPSPTPVATPTPDPTPTAEVSQSQWAATEKALVTNIDQDLINRLKGYILLQVKAHGEAWYVDEVSSQKYYLPDGSAAYQILRQFGLGITGSDLSKIPIGIEDRAETTDADADGLDDKLEEALGTSALSADSDNDGYSDGQEVKGGFDPLAGSAAKRSIDLSLVNRLRGKILLQVQSRGEAWYVNPADGKRYYMKDGQQAYQIMRFLSLGITNTDLRKIAVGELN